MADSESTQGKSTKREAAPKVETQDAPQTEAQDTGNGEDTGSIELPVSQLISDGSALLGHPSYVVAGALHGIDGDETMTIDDTTARIEAWLEQPVTVDPGQEG